MLNLKGKKIHQDDKFKYIGCCILDDLKPDLEIKIRMELLWSMFQKMKTLPYNNSLNLKL